MLQQLSLSLRYLVSLYTALWYRDSIVTLSIPATTQEAVTHSPSTIPFISFLPSSKFLLMSWISLSTLRAFCISPSSLSWNSVVSTTSSLISSVSGISQYRHLGNKIPTFRVSLLSPAVRTSPSVLVRASRFPPSFPDRYSILKLY